MTSNYNHIYRQAGGTVLYSRVEGQLAVSRAFGDHSLKDKVHLFEYN